MKRLLVDDPFSQEDRKRPKLKNEVHPFVPFPPLQFQTGAPTQTVKVPEDAKFLSSITHVNSLKHVPASVAKRLNNKDNADKFWLRYSLIISWASKYEHLGARFDILEQRKTAREVFVRALARCQACDDENANSKWRPGILCTRDTRNRLREHFIKQRKYKGRKKKVKSEFDTEYDENSPGCKCQRRWTAKQNGQPLPPTFRNIRSRSRSDLMQRLPPAANFSRSSKPLLLPHAPFGQNGSFFFSVPPPFQFSRQIPTYPFGTKFEEEDDSESDIPKFNAQSGNLRIPGFSIGSRMSHGPMHHSHTHLSNQIKVEIPDENFTEKDVEEFETRLRSVELEQQRLRVTVSSIQAEAGNLKGRVLQLENMLQSLSNHPPQRINRPPPQPAPPSQLLNNFSSVRTNFNTNETGTNPRIRTHNL